MSVIRAASAGMFVLVLLAIGAGAPAHASCTEDSGPSGSPVVFVGSVEEQRRGFTRFSVVEVWAGPDLASEVWVLSGQRQPPWPMSMFGGVGSSADADFRDGATYVVGTSQGFGTGACSVEEASSDLKEIAGRPNEPRAPVSNGEEGADPPIGLLGQTMWVAGFLAVLGLADALVRRHRHRP